MRINSWKIATPWLQSKILDVMANSNITEGPYSSSRIFKINKKEILKFINSGGTPIITGFKELILKVDLQHWVEVALMRLQ